MKLHLVEGIRHRAVVLAKTEGEAVELAMKVDEGGESAHELKLPKGWKIIQGDY
jgi:hypothetical protein